MDNQPVICGACGSVNSAEAMSCHHCGALIAAYRPPSSDKPPVPPLTPSGRSLSSGAGEAGAAARDLFGNAPRVVESEIRTPIAANPPPPTVEADRAAPERTPAVQSGVESVDVETPELSSVGRLDEQTLTIDPAAPFTDMPGHPEPAMDMVEPDRESALPATPSAIRGDDRAIRAWDSGKARPHRASLAKSATTLSTLRLTAGGSLGVLLSVIVATAGSVSDSAAGETLGLAAGMVGVVLLFDALVLALARREGRRRRTKGRMDTDIVNV